MQIERACFFGDVSSGVYGLLQAVIALSILIKPNDSLSIRFSIEFSDSLTLSKHPASLSPSILREFRMSKKISCFGALRAIADGERRSESVALLHTDELR